MDAPPNAASEEKTEYAQSRPKKVKAEYLELSEEVLVTFQDLLNTVDAKAA
jgi:hypothetical protein